MKILIIRHGEPDYSIDSLTEKGWREAELLSRRLAPLGIRDFYVSPLGRAQDTARPTLEKTGKKAETLPWLGVSRPGVGSLRAHGAKEAHSLEPDAPVLDEMP